MIRVLCDDIFKYFLPGIKAYKRDLFGKVHELSAYFYKNQMTINYLENLIELERKLINSKGPHKQFIEESIFQIFYRTTLSCSPEASDKKYLYLNKELVEKENDINEKKKIIIALRLVDFAIEIFNFKRARDNFSSKRKALSLEILNNLSNYYDLPKAFELCLLSLKSKKKDLILAALEFLENYNSNREIPLDKDIINILDKIVLQTKDRSVAVSALAYQVKTEYITEFEALSRIDEWKEKNEWLY